MPKVPQRQRPLLAASLAFAAVLLLALAAPAGEGRAEGEEAAQAMSASLMVRAYPWARVSIDGQAPSLTPWSAPRVLSAGEHHVTLEHPSFGRREFRLRLEAGESRVLLVDLERKR